MDKVSNFSFLDEVSKANFSSSNIYTKTDDKSECNSFSENNNEWHHAVLSKTLYEQAKKELY